MTCSYDFFVILKGSLSLYYQGKATLVNFNNESRYVSHIVSDFCDIDDNYKKYLFACSKGWNNNDYIKFTNILKISKGRQNLFCDLIKSNNLNGLFFINYIPIENVINDLKLEKNISNNSFLFSQKINYKNKNNKDNQFYFEKSIKSSNSTKNQKSELEKSMKIEINSILKNFSIQNNFFGNDSLCDLDFHKKYAVPPKMEKITYMPAILEKINNNEINSKQNIKFLSDKKIKEEIPQNPFFSLSDSKILSKNLINDSQILNSNNYNKFLHINKEEISLKNNIILNKNNPNEKMNSNSNKELNVKENSQENQENNKNNEIKINLLINNNNKENLNSLNLKEELNEKIKEDNYKIFKVNNSNDEWITPKKVKKEIENEFIISKYENQMLSENSNIIKPKNKIEFSPKIENKNFMSTTSWNNNFNSQLFEEINSKTSEFLKNESNLNNFSDINAKSQLQELNNPLNHKEKKFEEKKNFRLSSLNCEIIPKNKILPSIFEVPFKILRKFKFSEIPKVKLNKPFYNFSLNNNSISKENPEINGKSTSKVSDFCLNKSHNHSSLINLINKKGNNEIKEIKEIKRKENETNSNKNSIKIGNLLYKISKNKLQIKSFLVKKEAIIGENHEKIEKENEMGKYNFTYSTSTIKEMNNKFMEINSNFLMEEQANKFLDNMLKKEIKNNNKQLTKEKELNSEKNGQKLNTQLNSYSNSNLKQIISDVEGSKVNSNSNNSKKTKNAKNPKNPKQEIEKEKHSDFSLSFQKQVKRETKSNSNSNKKEKEKEKADENGMIPQFYYKEAQLCQYIFQN